MDGQRDKLADGLLLVCVALNIQVFQPRCPLCLGLQRATLQLLAAGNPPHGTEWSTLETACALPPPLHLFRTASITLPAGFAQPINR